MALTNDQYDKIINSYAVRKKKSADLFDSRLNEVQTKIPEYKALSDKVISLSMDYAKAELFKEPFSCNLKREIDVIIQKKTELLTQNGFPADYLTNIYVCPFCHDTGFVDNKKCRCFKQKEINLIYSESNINTTLKNVTLDDFSLRFYDENLIDPVFNVDSLKLARASLSTAQKFVRDFDTHPGNIIMFGNAGLGKTYLSHCIANEIIKKGHTVLYLTATELFSALGTFFKKGTGNAEFDTKSYIFDSELLIIDDLGSELVSEFSVSNLFTCINERLNLNRSTIISTNMDYGKLKNTYGERTTSRIQGYYQNLRFYGNDIRQVLRREKNAK